MTKIELWDLGCMLFPNVTTFDDIEEYIKSERFHTSKNIFTNTKRLMSELKTDNVLELYRDNKKTSEWIESDNAPPSNASKLMYYSALNYLSNPDKSKIAHKISKSKRRYFLDKANELGKIVRKEDGKNKLDSREKQAILPWKYIVSCYSRNRHTLNDDQQLIAALYLAGGDNPAGSPRRLDYNAIRIYHRMPDNPNHSENYIIIHSSDNIDIVLQEFKTRKYYGPYNARLPVKVSRIIGDSVLRKPRSWLIENDEGGPITAKQLGQRIRTTTAKLTGTPIGASNLRKSFITWLYEKPGMTEGRLEVYAKAMNHSPSEQKLYRRKDINKTVKNLINN
ncbi:hypothetical protein TetV_092 [Tetraselmis virus 1]|uniref:Uncharacterized protein n=1 Tax=Tetraselmis virus 1 TaxID=2060617 RepID=A0A2P0VMQ3_9VIRU|nr:hypothetical protein QJ968_gp092 [Tetraselmis virus 1]AUF82184.1 hypothetical protein TetV_092 [Tetraselmis virus 1]